MAPKKNNSKSPEEPKTKIESITKDLLCQLTPAEISDAAIRASFKDGEHDKAQSDFAEVKETWKEKLKKMNTERRELQQMAREGKTVRRVDCEMRFIFSAKPPRVDTVRLDLGEVIETRPMSQAEVQGELFPESKHDIDDEFDDEDQA